MKKNKNLRIILPFLSLFIFACSFFSAPSTPTPFLPTQEIPPTQTASPTPTKIPAPVLPMGVMTEKNGILSLFDREGYTLTQVDVSGISYADKSNVHIAGKFPAEGTNLPVVYFSFEQNSSLLFRNNEQTTTLLSLPDFFSLVGAVAEPIIAYSTIEDINGSLQSNLYLMTLNGLPTITSLLSENNAEGWGLIALAIDVDDAGKPSAIWYSKRPWGIGGDIVFEPRRTLFYLALGNGQSAQFLGADATPCALSANRKWLAYTNANDAITGVGQMLIRNLETGQNLSYPLQSAAEQRGAGAASFSPNNQYLAWMEGSGWQMSETPSFHSVIRIGDMNGNVIAEFSDMALTSISGMSLIARVEPVGWLDNNTLVVMAHGEYWDEVVLLMIDIPSQSSSFLAQGAFVGFVYP